MCLVKKPYNGTYKRKLPIYGFMDLWITRIYNYTKITKINAIKYFTKL